MSVIMKKLTENEQIVAIVKMCRPSVSSLKQYQDKKLKEILKRIANRHSKNASIILVTSFIGFHSIYV